MIKVSAVELGTQAANQLAKNILLLAGLKDKEARKRRNRIADEIRRNKYYTEEVKKCEECGNELVYFLVTSKIDKSIEPGDVKPVEEKILFLFDKLERKFIFDNVIEPLMKVDPPRWQKDQLLEIATALGQKWLDCLQAIIDDEKGEDLKDGEYEVVPADDEDRDEKKEEAKPDAAPEGKI